MEMVEAEMKKHLAPSRGESPETCMLKRAKYDEFFKGYFGEIEEVDKRTLLIQNRELFLHLQVLEKNVECSKRQMAELREARVVAEKKVASMGVFLDKFFTDVRLLSERLPGEVEVPESLKGSWICEVFARLFESADGCLGGEGLETLPGVSGVREGMLRLVSAVASSCERGGGRECGEGGELKEELSELRRKHEELLKREWEGSQERLKLKEKMEADRIEYRLIEEENMELKWKEVTRQRTLARLELRVLQLEEKRGDGGLSQSVVGSVEDGAFDERERGLSSEGDRVRESERIGDLEVLAKSRLEEIERLRSEKVELISQMAGGAPGGAGMEDGHIFDEFGGSGGFIERNRLIESENEAQKKKIQELFEELSQIRANHRFSIENLVREYRDQNRKLQHLLDRMTEKLKNMEQDRDQAKNKYQQLKGAIDSVKDDLSFMKKKVQGKQAEVARYKGEVQVLKKKLAEALSQLSGDVQVEISGLRSALSMSESKLKRLEEFDGDVSKVIELQASLDEVTRERDELRRQNEEQRKEVESLSSAIDNYYTSELQASTDSLEKMQVQLREKDGMLDEYRSEILSLRTAVCQKKKEDSMKLEEQATLTAKVGHLRALLQDETEQNRQLDKELEEQNRECLKLRELNERHQSVETHYVATISICKNKIEKMEEELKSYRSQAIEAKTKLEAEKSNRFRLMEELEVLKRRVAHLKSSKGGTKESQSKDGSLLAFYQRTYNCTLCSRERAADSILMTCTHARQICFLRKVYRREVH
ncbi:trichohyalin-like [Schistocerca gregaria]|uniref:trichohyalin-like n=1 Tax=Schistocerca gregaria TaxID=7010 RepID=UPI00211F35B3|nr:trichohyalin-like [Schistocerca gregaria]